MEITEVKAVLKEGPDKKLKAYATVTLDNCFVVRNIKVIKGTKGLFVAMPSRKMREPCPKCNYKNAIRSKFCNQCGSNLPVSGARDMHQEVRHSEHRDIAHPITLECREYIQKKVLDAYGAELKKSPSQNYEHLSPGSTDAQAQAAAPEKQQKPPEKIEPEESAADIKL